MKRDEFKILAKDAVIKIMESEYGIQLTQDDLDIDLYAHDLGYKKCTLHGEKMNDYHAEVTYQKSEKGLHVDIYQKVDSKFILLT